MKTSAIGRRYARALIELAEEQKQLEKVERELAAFAEAWDGSGELRDVFENPAIGQEQRKSVLEAIGRKLVMSPLLLNTLRFLSDRGRLSALPEIAAAFDELAKERSGRVRVEVTTATEMSPAYFAQLTKTLQDATDKKVVLVKKTDPSLIAGVVTRVGDKVFDGSVLNGLRELKEELLAP